jgi:hypothetical protein
VAKLVAQLLAKAVLEKIFGKNRIVILYRGFVV